MKTEDGIFAHELRNENSSVIASARMKAYCVGLRWKSAGLGTLWQILSDPRERKCTKMDFLDKSKWMHTILLKFVKVKVWICSFIQIHEHKLHHSHSFELI